MIHVNDFNKHCDVDRPLLEKYKSVVPESLIDLWKEYGFGSFCDDFLKVINPDDYRDQVKKSYYKGDGAIPILATSLGDVIVWEDNDHVSLIQYRDFKCSQVADSFEGFFSKVLSKELGS